AGLPAAYVIDAATNTVGDIYQTDSSGIEAAPINVSNGRVSLILFGTGIRNAPPGSVTATVGGLPAKVSYAGAQSQYPGLDQVNVLLPAALAGRGPNVPVDLTANGQPANIVRIWIE